MAVKSHVAAVTLVAVLTLCRADGTELHSCGVSRPLFKDTSIKVEPIDSHNWLQQGISAVLGWVNQLRFGFHPPSETKPQKRSDLRCLMPYLMNCTHWQALAAQDPCPEECPFIAQVKPFACAFTCVNVSQCHYTDPNMPFANPMSNLCEESAIEGCGVQAQQGQCERCRKHFAMDQGGTRCLYDREGSLIWLVEHLHAMGYWVWIVLVLMLSCCCWQFRGALAKHWHLLTFARMHYHLCKVRKNPKVHAGAPLFSICENLHTKFVIGVGLPLYYNSLVFLLIISVLLFLSTHLALDSDSQSLFNYSGVSSNPVQVLNVPIYPSAEGVSDASICSWAMEDDGLTRFNVQSASQSFMWRLSRTALFLWCSSLAIMLVHAWFQLKHARWFESQHLTMKDFALVLSGLPADVTDEQKLADCISRQIGETIRSVSIGYDVTSCWNEVETLLDRHLAYCDAHFCGHPDVGLRPGPQGGAAEEEILGPLAMRRNMEEDSQWVQDWFRPNSSKEMKGSGFAWAVFSSHRDRDEAIHKMLALEKDRRGIHWRDPDGTCYPLDFGIPRCEPTNVRWDHLGLGLCSRRLRFLGAVLIWSMAAAGLAFFVYVPYAEYVTGFLNEAGKFPQGFMMGLLGFLIGLTWWAMCMMIGTCVNIAGFQTIEDENLFIFIFFTIFCVAASAFNVYLTWYYTQDLWQHHTSSWFESIEGSLLTTGGPVTTLRDLRKEIDLGFRVFQVLVPGVLFTPCLLSPLNNFLIPYFRESALLVLFGQGKSGREAERFLEPLPIGLAWDYQGHVTLPCCCCLTLFIMSPSMWWAQAYLCIWAFFFYLFQRFMHLRVCKKMYCTSNKLDSMVLYFGWGLLLAELAACHAYWRVRLQEWQWISILQSVIMSYAIYWTFLWLLGVPWPLRLHGELDVLERSRERSDDDRCQSCEDFCYNWLNVNPVYVSWLS
ncbi:Hypothetical protein SCF082_LOCUS18593 [Durusdinium trenchii]|uniref:Uncharacterized protein n=1 Tax=Durusdinium trenchii TaxID=1381693 RepID=A0ABP0KSS5_9DINO